MCRSLVALTVIAGSLMLIQTSSTAQSSAAPKGSTSSRTAAKPASTGTVNLNTASAAELEGLPGVGAKMAGRIIEYRQKNGPFKKVEELMNVQGIGEKNFLKIKNQLTVGSVKAAERSSAQQ